MKYQSYSNIKTKPVFQREDVKILADIAEELKTVTSKDLQGEVIPENIKAKTLIGIMEILEEDGCKKTEGYDFVSKNYYAMKYDNRNSSLIAEARELGDYDMNAGTYEKLVRSSVKSHLERIRESQPQQQA